MIWFKLIGLIKDLYNGNKIFLKKKTVMNVNELNLYWNGSYWFFHCGPERVDRVINRSVQCGFLWKFLFYLQIIIALIKPKAYFKYRFFTHCNSLENLMKSKSVNQIFVSIMSIEVWGGLKKFYSNRNK